MKMAAQTMRNYIIILLILFSAATAHSFDAVNIMGALTGSEPPAEPVTPGQPAPAVSAPACGAGAMLPSKTCELGSGFLCLNTPPFGITESSVTLKGTIDVKNNTLSGLTASIQNEYTNEYEQVKFDKPADSSACWERDSNFCLDENGFYSLRLPVGEKLGPYTIILTAVRSNGAPASEKARLSRVTAPKMTKEDIKVTVNGSGAQVSIDLLKNCPACDFIGVTTGGLEITAKNVISAGDGGTKTTSLKTNSASGGIFSFCVPLAKGTNNITVTACNSASGTNASPCPAVALDPITSEEGSDGITWLKPIESFYDAATYPDVEIAFKLDTNADARLFFNRDPELALTPDANGEYHIYVNPSAGLNVGTIQSGDRFFSFSFSWGEVKSPFEAGGKVRPNAELWLKNAGGFALNKLFLTDAARTLLNNYFKSEEFKELLIKVPELFDKKDAGPKEDGGPAEKIKAIKDDIPFCKADGDEEPKNYGFKITSEPTIGRLEIPRIEFGQDTISLTFNAEDARVSASYFLDKDKDGEADVRPIPLKIAFKKIFTPVDLKVNRSKGKPLFLITAPTTDCEYKDAHACTGMPAVLVGKNFIGSATKGGSFVICDTDVEPDCDGVNLMNAHLNGQISAAVLDGINKMLYCNGSAALTYMLRERAANVPVQIGCPAGGYPQRPLIKIGRCSDESLLGDRGWVVPVGIDLLNNQFNVSEKGISGVVPAIVGDEGFFAGMSAEYKSPSVGIVQRPDLTHAPAIAGSQFSSYDFGISLGEDFINSIFFVLTEQNHGSGGLFDWDVHEVFMKKAGFDAVKKCDEFKPDSSDDRPSALCSLRLRVGDILGSALTANGYLPPKQPIMMRVKGNRNMPPRIAFFNDGRQFIDLQIPDIELSFYALEIDETAGTDKYGNFTVKLDADGRPIIRSMNPSDPAPENGQIIKFRLSIMLAAEISAVATDAADPSKLALTIRPDANLTKIVFKVVPGSNTTIIKPDSLISAFEEKIKYGVNIYSDPEKAIKIALPKEVSFDTAPATPDQFSLLGLKRLSFGKDGLQFKVEDSQEYIDIMVKFVLTQGLTVDGQALEWMIPE
jgi:hypothetical protein